MDHSKRKGKINYKKKYFLKKWFLQKTKEKKAPSDHKKCPEIINEMIKSWIEPNKFSKVPPS
jgi:hypothetical protein